MWEGANIAGAATGYQAVWASSDGGAVGEVGAFVEILPSRHESVPMVPQSMPSFFSLYRSARNVMPSFLAVAVLL